MPMSSLKLTSECLRRGLLSKEAGAEVLRTRQKLIEQAMRKEASSLFRAIRGGASQAGKQETVKRGLLSRLGSGGFTPGKGQEVGWGDSVGNMGKMLGLAGLAGGAAAGGSALLQHSQNKKRDENISKSYTQMFEKTPELKEEDPETVKRQFGVLARYAPSLASDPVVAGSWVRQRTEMGAGDMVDPKQIDQLTQIQRRIDESAEKRSPFNALGNLTRPMGVAAKAMGAG